MSRQKARTQIDLILWLLLLLVLLSLVGGAVLSHPLFALAVIFAIVFLVRGSRAL